jgi:osmotically inducible lipoprotein OsmB
MTRSRMVLAVSLSVAVVVSLSGCASGSNASSGAASGAKTGAIGGIVAGAVGALLWGGNPVEGAVKAGITGAAAGAAVGAVAGAEADKAAQAAAQTPAPKPAPQPAPQPTPQPASAKYAEAKAAMGDKVWDAAVLLAHCRHTGAISAAESAFAAETDATRKVYALLVEALAAEESGDRATAAAIYPRIVAADPARGDEAALRTKVLEGVIKLQRLRQDNGLPPLCPAS